MKISPVGQIDRATGHREVYTASGYDAGDLDALVELTSEAAKHLSPMQLEQGL